MSAKCPERFLHRVEHEIIRVVEDLYQCACGCLFTWAHDFEWEVLNQSQAFPKKGPLKRTAAEVSVIEKWLARRGFFTKHYPPDSLYTRMNKALLHLSFYPLLDFRIAFAWGRDKWELKRLGKELDFPTGARYNGIQFRASVRGYDLVFRLRFPWRDMYYSAPEQEDSNDQPT